MAEQTINKGIKIGALKNALQSMKDDLYLTITEDGILHLWIPTEVTTPSPKEKPSGDELYDWGASRPCKVNTPAAPIVVLTPEMLTIQNDLSSPLTISDFETYLKEYVRNKESIMGLTHTAVNKKVFSIKGKVFTDKVLREFINANKEFINYCKNGKH